ncbi:MAG: hypothetical protein V4755_11325 [Curtobacterium sp.]
MTAAPIAVVERATLRLPVGEGQIECRIRPDEVGLEVIAGLPGAARLLGFQQDRWSPTLTVVAGADWAADPEARARVAAEGMLPVIELHDGRIVQLADSAGEALVQH